MPPRDKSLYRKRLLLVSSTVLVLLGLGIVFLTGPVLADHHSEHGDLEMNATIKPKTASDHKPGITDATYQFWIGPSEVGPTFWETEYVSLQFPEGALVYEEFDCSINAVGIDRGNNNSDMETDEEVTNRVKDSNLIDPPEDGTDEIWAVMNQREDLNEHLKLNPDDMFVAELGGCFTNPDEPGWYRYSTFFNGTAPDEETHISAESPGNWIWICDCENEQEARNQLGKPPHEGQPAETPTPTAESKETATATETAKSEETETATEMATPTMEETPTPMGTAAADDDGGEDTETDANNGGGGTPAADDGPGFGATVAILGLLGAALFVLRRTDG